MIRIGIYGGTFSPVHNGHIAAAKAFMEQMWLDVLYIIPAGVAPNREDEDEDVSAKDRLRMCELAFESMDGVFVSDMEIRRPGKSFTVDTIRELYSPDNRLFLLLGSDKMMSLDHWQGVEDIFKLSYPAYVRRDNDPSVDDEIVKKEALFQQKYGKIVRKIVTEPIILSSTDIRETIRTGGDISDMVPASVAQYIKDRQLYL